MPTVYARRQAVELDGAFVNQAGQPADPDTVELVVHDPSGAITHYTYGSGDAVISRSGVGSYSAVVQTPVTGTYYYGWYGTTGLLRTAQETYFIVADTGSGL